METQPVRIRGLGKGGASRYGKSKKKGKQSPRKSGSLKRTPSGSPDRTRSASRSSSGSIEIDRETIERARQDVAERNAERKKYDIPKEYQNYPMEDIPLKYLKPKKSSPAKKAKQQSPKKVKTPSTKKAKNATKISKALDRLKNNDNITIFKIIKGKEGLDLGSKLLLAGDELYDYFEEYSDQEQNDAITVLLSQKSKVNDKIKEKIGVMVLIGEGDKFIKYKQFYSEKRAVEWWNDYKFWK